jgi:tungstate transport system substrate-binding protein
MEIKFRPILILLCLLAVFSLLLGACTPTAPTQANATQPSSATAYPIATPTQGSQEATAYPVADIPTQSPATAYPAPSTEIILATTTSTQDSGLLDVLLPDFTQKTGYTVKTVAVGSGAAMAMGEQGNADVLLVHSPAAEKDYMAKNLGIERQLVMHNDFIIVGPSADPAVIKGLPSAVEAFKKIAEAKAAFVSRDDKSGTNAAELNLWKSAGLSPTKDDAWYISSGQGMGATLKIASEKNAYTLTDRATYLANKANLSLDLLVEKDNVLLNVYHVIIVNPEKWPKINLAGARAFAAYLVSPEGQALIGSFGQEKFGQPLFVPDAGKQDSDLGLP